MMQFCIGLHALVQVKVVIFVTHFGVQDIYRHNLEEGRRVCSKHDF